MLTSTLREVFVVSVTDKEMGPKVLGVVGTHQEAVEAAEGYWMEHYKDQLGPLYWPFTDYSEPEDDMDELPEFFSAPDLAAIMVITKVQMEI